MTYTITLLSGGLDSTVLAADLLHDGDRVEALSVDYGQRHRRELAAAALVASYYGIRHDVVDLSGLRTLLLASSLTSDAPVPHGHYAAANMAQTVVPNRNAILLMVAAGVASSRGADRVATAVHAGDHFVYPDCRPEFITAASAAARLGTAGFGDITVEAPFVTRSKAQLVTLGAGLAAPLGVTWSCYEGGVLHCGRCGTCVERAAAFEDAGVVDPTEYADPSYWRTVIEVST